MRKIDLTSKIFGRLTVIRQNGVLPNGHHGKIKAWLCLCSCGNTVTVRGRDLKTGNTTSCGCYASEQKKQRSITHGMSGKNLYKIWASMKKRCHGVGNHQSKRFYKGITLCDEWQTFEPFMEWSLPKYQMGLVIDRIDTFKGYSPENCRFVTSKENNQNTKRSRIWIIGDKQFNSAYDAATELGCSQSHIDAMCNGRNFNGKFYPPHPNCRSIRKYQGRDNANN